MIILIAGALPNDNVVLFAGCVTGRPIECVKCQWPISFRNVRSFTVVDVSWIQFVQLIEKVTSQLPCRLFASSTGQAQATLCWRLRMQCCNLGTQLFFTVVKIDKLVAYFYVTNIQTNSQYSPFANGKHWQKVLLSGVLRVLLRGLQWIWRKDISFNPLQILKYLGLCVLIL